MRLSKFLIFLCAAPTLLLSSCVKSYWMTAPVCDGKLFVEIFKVSPIGEDEDYLTDSTNFRIYIGMSDPEQTTYTYACDGDSIIIKEVTLGRESNYKEHKLLSKKAYSLPELRKKHNL